MLLRVRDLLLGTGSISIDWKLYMRFCHNEGKWKCTSDDQKINEKEKFEAKINTKW